MTITTTNEGGGHVSTCVCRWVRYAATHNEAAEQKREHLKKCKAGGDE